MGRLVRTTFSPRDGRRIEKLASNQDDESNFSKYAGRLIKMIPGEAVAAFLALDTIAKAQFPKVQGDPVEARVVALSWGIFVFVLLLNLGYLRLTKSKEDSVTDFAVTAVVGTIAFMVWVYSIQASVVQLTGWYWAPLAASLIVAVTCLAPFTAGKLGSSGNKANS